MYSQRDGDGMEAALPEQGSWRTVALAHSQMSPGQLAEPNFGQRQPKVLQRGGNLIERYDAWRHEVGDRIERFDLAPDLASGIGSRTWFRGLGTLIGLSALAIGFWPSFGPLEAAPAMAIDEAARDEFRSQMIMPLALGGDSGRHMGATLDVKPLRSAPERPTQQMVATLSRGDSFARMLARAGVGSGDANRVMTLVSGAIALGAITPGTKVDITLGRRAAPGEPRPLDSLSFRARFDLALEVARGDGGLALTRKPIRVDDTPLRIRGAVGRSLYRSLRSAGAPPSAVQQYLSALGDQVDMERTVRPSDTFDLVVQYRRAATGEREAGRLVYAGIDRGEKPQVQLMRWGKDGRFYEASGVGEQRAGLLAPVPGRISSNFGMRRHPILGYRRMHSGMDFASGHGTPIVAVTDGRVSGAGRMGGCGIAVRLEHGGGLSTRYCHMSRMAVRPGQGVRRGQVIGYVGSTGLSTGAHLHYEMYRGGRAVNPASVSFVTRAMLSGEELRRFRANLSALKTVAPGAALVDLAPSSGESAGAEPTREIDKLDQARPVL